MQKASIILILSFLCLACENNQFTGDKSEGDYIARVASYDLNCYTCIVEFPFDSLAVKKKIGKSPGNYYNTNLSKEDYKTGQLLRVKIRQPVPEEMRACITLYPSDNHLSIFVKESENPAELVMNDTVELFNKDCKFNTKNNFYLCLDSIMEDSRCPEGAYCYWAGNAKVRFRFEKVNEPPVYFVLNTYYRFPQEILIDTYKISLVDLLPRPSLSIPPDRRKAVIVIRDTSPAK